LIEHGLRSAPTQYRLYGRPFLQVKRPNQQYQSTEGNIQIQIKERFINDRKTVNVLTPYWSVRQPDTKTEFVTQNALCITLYEIKT